MKKCIAILIAIIPILGFGQVMTIKKLPPFPTPYVMPYVMKYSLFQANVDQYYTKCINEDRANSGKTPLVNSKDLNELALRRALSYAEYIIGVENSGIDTTPDPLYVYKAGTSIFGYSSFGREIQGYKRNPHYGSICPENFNGCINPAGYKIGYSTSSIETVTESGMVENNSWLVGDHDFGIKKFYKNSTGHRNTRLNEGTVYGKRNWKKYGYAILFILVEGPNPHYTGTSESKAAPTIVKHYMISYEVFSE